MRPKLTRRGTIAALALPGVPAAVGVGRDRGEEE